MNKIRTKCPNLKIKERNTILEFLFNESDSNSPELENYIGKYLESKEKWRLVFDCIQKIDLTSGIKHYLYELMDNMRQILPNLKISVVIYENGKNRLYTRQNDEINSQIFSCLNFFHSEVELVKFFNSRAKKVNYKLLPLEKKGKELGFIYFELKSYEENDAGYLENLCKYIISAMDTIKLHEKIKKDSEEKTKFTASVSHEIKTPLNGIIAYAELLKKNSSALPLELKNYAENIYTSSRQLKCLVLDIIDTAKFEYGKVNVQKETFEARRAIENVLKIFAPLIKEKNLTVNPVLMQINIKTDNTKFSQILYNLISNAIKFSNPKTEIFITSWAQEEKFFFEIKNTGAPPSKETSEKIFNFLQSEISPQNQEGSGIGLCVSKRLVEILGGKIAFESKENSTVFNFYLPL